MFVGPAMALVGLGAASYIALRPERASELSGLMCMAISGGAIIPLLMGQLRDSGLKATAFVVPVACFAYLLLLSLRGGRKLTPAPAPVTAGD